MINRFLICLCEKEENYGRLLTWAKVKKGEGEGGGASKEEKEGKHEYTIKVCRYSHICAFKHISIYLFLKVK